MTDTSMSADEIMQSFCVRLHLRAAEPPTQEELCVCVCVYFKGNTDKL